MDDFLKTIEALLFVSGESVRIDKLAKFLKRSEEECRGAVDQLREKYLEDGSAFALVEKDSAIQIVTKPELGELCAAFMNKNIDEELSSSAMEVLAVVAYRGPVTRSAIEQIRGVNCSFALRNLAMRGLIERRENPADVRSYLYEVSMDFLKSVGISRLEDLPDFENMRKAEIPQLKTSEIGSVEENKTKE